MTRVEQLTFYWFTVYVQTFRGRSGCTFFITTPKATRWAYTHNPLMPYRLVAQARLSCLWSLSTTGCSAVSPFVFVTKKCYQKRLNISFSHSKIHCAATKSQLRTLLQYHYWLDRLGCAKAPWPFLLNVFHHKMERLRVGPTRIIRSCHIDLSRRHV